MTKTSVARVLATWFGCGLFPVAPGTVGSLAAIVIALVLPLSSIEIGIMGVLLFPVSVWAAGVTARDMRLKDPSLVVIDEVVGQWITMAGATRLCWQSWLLGFFFFRLFDIVKPFLIRRLEKLPGGWGITADDALAGVYAALVLYMLGRFNIY